MAEQDFTYTPPAGRGLDFSESLINEGLNFLAQKSEGTMWVDLADCRIVHSREIGALVYLKNKFDENQRPFAIKNPNDQIRYLFDKMNLSDFLQLGSAPRRPAAQEQKPTAFKVDYESAGGIGIFKFSGAVKSSKDSSTFMNIINKILTDKQRMLIDLSGVTYMDSLAIGVVARLLKLIKEGKIEVRFLGMTDMLKEILQANQLYDFIQVYQTKDEALKDWA
jgi:anti-anti-sigma factor